MSIDDSLPDRSRERTCTDLAQRAGAERARSGRATAAESEAQYRALLIEKLKYTIAKLRHERFGQSSERGALLEQLELAARRSGRECSAGRGGGQDGGSRRRARRGAAFERRKPARRPLPEHLPRERIVYPAPAACPCCGGATLRKLGEDVTETLELVPAPVEGDPARAREVLLPRLRGNHAAAGALASDRTRAGGAAAAGP